MTLYAKYTRVILHHWHFGVMNYSSSKPRTPCDLELPLTQWELLNKFQGKMAVRQWYIVKKILCHLFAVQFQHVHGQEGIQLVPSTHDYLWFTDVVSIKSRYGNTLKKKTTALGF